MQTPINEIVSALKSLEPFPTVAARVLVIAGRDDVVPNELIELVQTDPGITSKVLKLCNSAYYGFQREITSLHDAGNLLGTTTLVNLVLTSSAAKYFKNYGSASAASHQRLWERSVANAIGARIIAKRHGRTDPERAYTAGLLENIGNMVLDRFMDEGRAGIRAVAASGSAVIDAEKEVLGLDHAEIGARLSARWSLPDVMVDTIRHHHDPENATVEPELTATVHLAEVLTQSLLAGDDPDELLYETSAAAYELTGLSENEFAALEDDLREELERAKEFLDS